MREDKGFICAAGLLPGKLQDGAFSIGAENMSLAEEIRLRTGYPPTVLLPGGEREIWDEKLTHLHIASVLEKATNASVHTALASMKKGFVTVKGGCRIGICGNAIIKDGEIQGIRNPSSLSIRIPREKINWGNEVLDKISPFKSTLIISPPGGGKTTLLRDLIRLLSNNGRRISLADERGEVAAVWEGAAQFDVGCKTDILTGGDKAAAIMLLLRGMNPQTIAIDEITAPEDVSAIERASNCGVSFLATAHADSISDLESRSLYKELLEKRIFKYIVTIQKKNGEREVRALECY